MTRTPNTDRKRRGTGLALLVTTVALLAAACGGTDEPEKSVANLGPSNGAPSSSSGLPAQAPDGVAFAKCMRENGLPQFQDPKPNQGMGEGVDPNSEAFKTAAKACQQFAPAAPPQAGGPGDVWPAADKLKYSACMRENGIPNFPDPDANGGFRLEFDPNTPQFKKAEGACAKFQPENLRNMQPNKQGGPAAPGSGS